MASVRLNRSRWLRAIRNAAIALVVLFVVIGIAGFFVAPGIVKSLAVSAIAEQLGRKATIASVKLNPYLLSATVDDFKLYEPDGTTVAAQIDEVVADVSSASLFKRALVFDELRITRPRLSIARIAPQRFSFSDIVDKILAKPKSESPFRFSVNNIRLEGGAIAFDDRVTGRKHLVDNLRVGVPFVSNLPYDTDIFVTPDFAARVNGSPIELTGKAQLFSSTREAAVELDVADLDLPTYMGFVPTQLRFKIASGKLAAKLALRFRSAAKDDKGQTTPQAIGVSGYVAVNDMRLTDRNDKEAVSARSIEADIIRLDPLRGDVALQRVAIAEPHVEATRRRDGSIDLIDLFTPAASAAPASNPAPTTPGAAKPGLEPGSKSSPGSSPDWSISIASFKLDNGSLRFTDQMLATPADRPIATTLKNIHVESGAFDSHGDAPTTYDVTLASEDGASIEARGQAVVAKRSASGTIAIKQFRPARVAPYLASYLVARIDEGSIDASARYRIDASGPRLLGHVDELTVRIEKLRTTLPSEKAALIGADAILLDGGAFDLGTRAFTAASLKLTAPVVAIKRDAKGNINLRAALVEAQPAATPRGPQTSAAGVTVAPETGPAFTAIVKTLLIEQGDLSFEDAAAGRPVRVRAASLNLKAENIGTGVGTGVGTSNGAAVPFDLSTTIEQRGKLAVKGRFTLSPLMIDASIDANQVAVGWAVAYAGDRLNVNVESADLNARGTLHVEESRKPGATTGPMNLAYRGSAGVVRLRALDKLTSEEFVRWKSLDIPKVDVQMPARSAPIAVTLGNVTLTDFYARLIVNANGRLNVQDVVARPGERQSVTTPDAAPTSTPDDEKQTPRESTATIPAPASTTASGSKPGPKPMIRVAGVKLVSGRIGVTDNFVKPNYSANLTDLNGDISAIASNEPKPADVHVLGRIDGDGSLDVSGKINLFAATAYTDIAAEAKDIELTRLSPYAIKYAGYAIERGKLSMTVKYHIENGKLDAQNRLFLDQLTFGEKVDSPTATSLPVRLAVSLLKNSRGEINLNLPISGTLSDPQFSIGGVIWNAIVNILKRAVSAPFSLIASAVGGGGNNAEQLGYVEFAPGVSDLSADAKKKLDTLAKALADRPQLKLDIVGRFDPVSDPEGIKRDHLLDRLKDLKAKDLSKPGEPIGRDDVTIARDNAADEYRKLLARVYDDTKLPDKPRNLIGLAKTLPIEEMEKLLLANIKLDSNDPRWLAEARADVVRHYIEDTDKIDRSRVFLVQPKLNSQGVDDGAKPTRVDFALH